VILLIVTVVVHGWDIFLELDFIGLLLLYIINIWQSGESWREVSRQSKLSTDCTGGVIHSTKKILMKSVPTFGGAIILVLQKTTPTGRSKWFSNMNLAVAWLKLNYIQNEENHVERN